MRAFDSWLPRGSRVRAGMCAVLLTSTLTSCNSKNPVAAACAGLLVVSAVQTSFFIGQQVQLQASYGGDDTNCDASQVTWQADPSRVTLSQTVGAAIVVTALAAGLVDVTASDDFGHSASSTLTARRNTTDLQVLVTGLLANTLANILVTGPNNFQRTVTGTTTLTDLAVGLYTIQILSVIAANGHRFGYSGAAITRQLTPDELHQIDAPYAQQTGEVVISPQGVPSGLTGPAGRILGAAVTTAVLFNSLRVILDPGQYSFEGGPVDPNGYNYQPVLASQSFLVTAGAVTTLTYAWLAQRALLTLGYTGLPLGTIVNLLFSRAGAQQQLGEGEYYLAPGDATLTAPDVTINDATARLRNIFRVTAATLALTLIAGQMLPVEFQYWLYQQYTFYAVGAAVLSDPRGHHPFVALWLLATLSAAITYVEPSTTSRARAADPTITITGPAPFVTVTGTLAPDGSFVATGSGTVAGFSNVPVRLTGTLAPDGTITGDYRLGQDTAPTGLPGGSITYRITGAKTNLPAS